MVRTSKLKQVKTKLGIDERLTRVKPKKKKFNKVKDNIPQYEHYNYMADVMFMPTDKFGYKYALVVVDLANDEFDIEPMKHKDPDTIMSSLKKIFKRDYIKKPEFSMTTDAGKEFLGVVKRWMYDESIYHKITLPGRHKQLANVDNLINQLNSLFNGLMNKVEKQTGKVSKAWTKYVPQIRELLNEVRRKDLDPDYDQTIPETTDKKGRLIKPKFKVGDLVHVLLDRQVDANSKVLPGKFRTGDYRYDSKPREIKQVLTYSGDVLYRYNKRYQIR